MAGLLNRPMCRRFPFNLLGCPWHPLHLLRRKHRVCRWRKPSRREPLHLMTGDMANGPGMMRAANMTMRNADWMMRRPQLKLRRC